MTFPLLKINNGSCHNTYTHITEMLMQPGTLLYCMLRLSGLTPNLIFTLGEAFLPSLHTSPSAAPVSLRLISTFDARYRQLPDS